MRRTLSHVDPPIRWLALQLTRVHEKRQAEDGDVGYVIESVRGDVYLVAKGPSVLAPDRAATDCPKVYHEAAVKVAMGLRVEPGCLGEVARLKIRNPSCSRPPIMALISPV